MLLILEENEPKKKRCNIKKPIAKGTLKQSKPSNKLNKLNIKPAQSCYIINGLPNSAVSLSTTTGTFFEYTKIFK